MAEHYVECSRCREQVTFSHIVGKEQWLHVRTGAHRCQPQCSEPGCGQPATERVGAVTVGGDGFLTFRTHKWLCADHINDQLRIHYE
jgi:hypothetical protein